MGKIPRLTHSEGELYPSTFLNSSVVCGADRYVQIQEQRHKDHAWRISNRTVLISHKWANNELISLPLVAVFGVCYACMVALTGGIGRCVNFGMRFLVRDRPRLTKFSIFFWSMNWYCTFLGGMKHWLAHRQASKSRSLGKYLLKLPPRCHVREKRVNGVEHSTKVQKGD